MTQNARPTVGLIGLGLMGSAISEQLLTAGFDVLGFDLRPECCEQVACIGGRAAACARDVVRSADRVLFSVMTTDQVASVLEECCGDLRADQIVIDTSTGSPTEMTELAARLAGQGVSYLDATLAGSSADLRRREVLALVGGDSAALERSRDLFDCIAKQVFYLGLSGAGARMKLVFNLVLGLHRAVLAEGLQFATKIGIEPQTALDVLKSGVTYSRVMDTKGQKMLTEDFTPQAKLAQHLKDVLLMQELGAQHQAKLPLTELHRSLLAACVAAGCGELDNSAIIRAFD